MGLAVSRFSVAQARISIRFSKVKNPPGDADPGAGTYARPGSLTSIGSIIFDAGRRIEMIGEPKRKPHQDDCDRKQRERMHQEEALDEALKNTFPASDPVSVEQP
jgi:hypothetical protein